MSFGGNNDRLRRLQNEHINKEMNTLKSSIMKLRMMLHSLKVISIPDSAFNSHAFIEKYYYKIK